MCQLYSKHFKKKEVKKMMAQTRLAIVEVLRRHWILEIFGSHGQQDLQMNWIWGVIGKWSQVLIQWLWLIWLKGWNYHQLRWRSWNSFWGNIRNTVWADWVWDICSSKWKCLVVRCVCLEFWKAAWSRDKNLGVIIVERVFNAI